MVTNAKNFSFISKPIFVQRIDDKSDKKDITKKLPWNNGKGRNRENRQEFPKSSREKNLKYKNLLFVSFNSLPV